MKKHRIWFWLLGSILSLWFAGSIFGAEKECIDVLIHETLITEDMKDASYEGPLQITIHAIDKETLASLKVEVKQEGISKDIAVTVDEENLTAMLTIEEGINYDIYIKTLDKNISLTNITVFEKIAVYANDVLLQDTYSSNVNVLLHTNDNAFFDIDNSYLMINEEKMFWSKTNQGYEFLIGQEGVFYIEFHFIDYESHEYITKAKIIKEVNDKKIDIEFSTPFNEHEKDFYFSNTIKLTLNTNIIDIDKLQIYVNDQPYECEWYPQDFNYTTYLEIVDEGKYTPRIYYDGQPLDNFYTDKTLILDKTPPEVLCDLVSATISNQDIVIHFAAYDEHNLTYEVEILKDGVHMQTNSGQGSIEKSFILHEESGTNTYEIRAIVSDYAGNVIAMEPLIATIDKDPPIIDAYLQGNLYEQPIITNRSVQLHMQTSDKFIASRKLLVYKNDQLIEDTILENDDFEKTVTSLQMRRDAYEYILQVSDIAGNISEKNIEFIIDQDMPPLQIANDIFRGYAQNVSWTPEIIPLEKPIEVIDTQMIKDQKEIHYEWGNEIVEDGQYRLDITAKDEAGNLAHLEHPFYFTIDKTPPTIYVINSNTNQEVTNDYVGPGLEINIQSGFLREDKILSVTANHQQILDKQIDKLRVPLETAGVYEIEIIAEDEAKNIAKKKLRFEIQKDTSKDWNYMIIGGIVSSILYICYRVCKS